MEIALGLVGAFIVALCYAATRVTPKWMREAEFTNDTYRNSIDADPYITMAIICTMALIVFMILGAQIAFDFGCPC